MQTVSCGARHESCTTRGQHPWHNERGDFNICCAEVLVQITLQKPATVFSPSHNMCGGLVSWHPDLFSLVVSLLQIMAAHSARLHKQGKLECQTPTATGWIRHRCSHPSLQCSVRASGTPVSGCSREVFWCPNVQCYRHELAPSSVACTPMCRRPEMLPNQVLRLRQCLTSTCSWWRSWSIECLVASAP